MLKKSKSKSCLNKNPSITVRKPEINAHVNNQDPSKKSLKNKNKKISIQEQSTKRHTSSNQKHQKTICAPKKLSKHLNKDQLFKDNRKNSLPLNNKPQSRMSNKRTSVVSSKSHKDADFKQKQKQNDKNHNNQSEINTKKYISDNIESQLAKQKIKKLKAKQKDLLSIDFRQKCQNKQIISKAKKPAKKEKIQKFQQKLSKYLNEKDIFSSDFKKSGKRESKNHSKSKSSFKSHQKQSIFDRGSIQKYDSQRQLYGTNKNKCQIGKDKGLLQIYKFYKNTFDINLNNCLKISKNTTKLEKTDTRQKIRPSSCSAVLHQNNKKFPSKLSSNSNYGDHKQVQMKYKGQQLAQIKRSINKFNQVENQQQCLKINQNRCNQDKKWLQKGIQLSKNIIQERIKQQKQQSKKWNDSSQLSTKDNLLINNLSQYPNNSLQFNKNQSSDKINKKTYRNLIIFKEKDQNNSKNDTYQKQKQKQNIQNLKEDQSILNMRNIDIGISRISVLNWAKIDQKEQFIRLPKRMIQIAQDKEKQEQKYNKNVLQKLQQKISTHLLQDKYGDIKKTKQNEIKVVQIRKQAFNQHIINQSEKMKQKQYKQLHRFEYQMPQKDYKSQYTDQFQVKVQENSQKYDQAYYLKDKQLIQIGNLQVQTKQIIFNLPHVHKNNVQLNEKIEEQQFDIQLKNSIQDLSSINQTQRPILQNQNMDKYYIQDLSSISQILQQENNHIDLQNIDDNYLPVRKL